MLINQVIDHTLLEADASQTALETLFLEAIDYDFKVVCVQPCWVFFTKKMLQGTNVRVSTVIGYPYGATTTEAKIYEVQDALSNGAVEVAVVLNISALKSKQDKKIIHEIKAVMRAAQDHALVRFVIETALLTDEEVRRVCRIVQKEGVKYIQLSTGFLAEKPMLEQIRLIRQMLGPQVGMKVCGKIRTVRQAQQIIAAGVNRLGSSFSVAIINESKKSGEI